MAHNVQISHLEVQAEFIAKGLMAAKTLSGQMRAKVVQEMTFSESS